MGKNGIANQWSTFVLRAVVRTGPHPIVTLTLILLDLNILIFRFLLRGGVLFQ